MSSFPLPLLGDDGFKVKRASDFCWRRHTVQPPGQAHDSLHTSKSVFSHADTCTFEGIIHCFVSMVYAMWVILQVLLTGASSLLWSQRGSFLHQRQSFCWLHPCWQQRPQTPFTFCRNYWLFILTGCTWPWRAFGIWPRWFENITSGLQWKIGRDWAREITNIGKVCKNPKTGHHLQKIPTWDMRHFVKGQTEGFCCLCFMIFNTKNISTWTSVRVKCLLFFFIVYHIRWY